MLLYPLTRTVTASAQLFAQTASATVANTTTETTLASTGEGSLTLPANFLRPGRTVRVRASGFASDTGTPTLRFRVKLGSTTIGDTGAIALTGTVSNEGFVVDYELTCRTAGASGTVIGQGFSHVDNSTNTGLLESLPSTAAVTVNTTTAQAVSVTAQWGTASSSNTITCTNLVVESKG